MEHHLSEERWEELCPKGYAIHYSNPRSLRSIASWSDMEVMWAPPKWESWMADEERETLLRTCWRLLQVKRTRSQYVARKKV